MTELDSPETHIYISTRGYREWADTEMTVVTLD